MYNQHVPTFSVFSVIKNIESRKDQFLRSVQSVLKQDFEDFEFVIQDGASTDGTLELLAGFDDKRIVLVSESDSCGEEGFFRALKRCRGRYIASCLSDEELAPGALQKAFDVFQENQDIAAFYGNYGSVNKHGEKWGPHIPGHPFTIEDYVCQKIVPPFCSSFFRRSHLEKAGLHTHHWRYNIGEFEFWIRIAGTGDIIYKPLMLSYFGHHSSSNTSNGWLYDVLTSQRAAVMQIIFDENSHLKGSSVSVEQAISGNFKWAAISVRDIEGESERYKLFMRLAFSCNPHDPHMKFTRKPSELPLP